MRVVEAPEPYEPAPGDGPSVFLAGGITGCPDWQATAIARFTGTSLVVFNPRRTAFDVARGDTAVQQIAWEYERLSGADLTLFWFPAGAALQPIALYELGFAAAGARAGTRRIVVGAEDGYPRRLDVVEQLRHALPAVTVHPDLDATLEAAFAAVSWPPPQRGGAAAG